VKSVLTDHRPLIELELNNLLPASSTAPEKIHNAIRWSMFAGGKRFRPALVLATGQAFGADIKVLIRTACAFEMIHTYSLIHDDLPAMDDDVLRRGRPTLHVIAGDGMAILAGDALHAEAFGLLAREPVSTQPSIAERKLRVITRIADAAGPAGMVGGQAIDLEAVRPGPGRHPEPLDPPAVERMHARKTGALIRASAAAGAIMAGAGDALIAAIDRYAAQIGLAFQIVDDILDIEAASADLGKTAGKDAAAGKPTYPAVVGLEQSRAIAADCLTRAEQALRDARLSDSHLAGIARWVVTRRS
jgi:geranylgeranyl pyrophosphate synthase